MEKIGVEILGRHLGVAMSSDEKTYQAFTVYAFHPAPGVNLPELCDLVIDCAHGWVIPIRGDGAGEVAYPPGEGPDCSRVIDLVDLLHSIPRK
jgi:hypothetical protein